MLEIEVEDSGLPDRLEELASRLEDARSILADAGGYWQRRVKKSMPEHGPNNPEPADEGEPPAIHTSEYVHSIIYEAEEDELRLGSSSIRARILHEGGTIRARSGMLSVPIAAESYGKRPADFSGLELGPRFRSQGMNKVLLGRPGEGEDFEPLFVLQPQVTIKPHPHIEFTRDDRVYLGDAIQDASDEAMEI